MIGQRQCDERRRLGIVDFASGLCGRLVVAKPCFQKVHGNQQTDYYGKTAFVGNWEIRF